ncbi:MAG TPA: CPBP family glutamic-type intramembrane protease [Planctomycetota bacterium]|nr:CPBP family glutamic-type intramembrane protease [Planctomycetota bacterium]
MSARPAAADLVPALQLLAALGCVLVISLGQMLIGLVLLAMLAIAWPPAVPWRPVAALRVLLVYVPFAVVWMAFVALYLQVAHRLGHTVSVQPDLAQIAAHGVVTPELLCRCLGIVFVAPLAEEVLFRGYLFTALSRALPSWATQLATAVAFGLVHGLEYALPITALALLFGWLRARHSALLPCVLAHTVHNGLTVAVTMLWPEHLRHLYPQ